MVRRRLVERSERMSSNTTTSRAPGASSSSKRQKSSHVPSSSNEAAQPTTSTTSKQDQQQQQKMFVKPKKSPASSESDADKKSGWFSKTTNQVKHHKTIAGSLSPQLRSIDSLVKAPFDPYNMTITGPKYPDVVPCFVEVSKESRNKYEWDHDLGVLTLDRVLHSAVYYPHNYGFIPQTLCGDGDPLDILVMSTAPLVPGCVVFCRPICYMVMEDEKGMDEKVLAVNAKDAHYADIKSMKDLHEHTLREIAEFFATYKKLEKDKWAKVGGWRGTEDTITLIKDSHENYKKQFDIAMAEPSAE